VSGTGGENRDTNSDLISYNMVYDAGRAAQAHRRPSAVFRASQATRDSDTFTATSSQVFDVGLDNESTDFTSEYGDDENIEMTVPKRAVVAKATRGNVTLARAVTLSDVTNFDANSVTEQSVHNRYSILPSEPKHKRLSDSGSFLYAKEQASIIFSRRRSSNAPVMCPRMDCRKIFDSERLFINHFHIHVIGEGMFRCNHCGEEFDTQEKVQVHDCSFRKISPISGRLAKKILDVVKTPLKLGIENAAPIGRGLRRSKTFNGRK